MAIIRVNKTENYTIMSNYHFKEKDMSLKAKGLLSLMLSLPDNWDFSIMGLITLSKDGKASVMATLQELENFRYLKRTKILNGKGQFKGYDYDIYEMPYEVEEETIDNQPYSENPNTEKPNTENRPQLNIKELNTEELKEDRVINNDKQPMAENNSFFSSYENETKTEQIPSEGRKEVDFNYITNSLISNGFLDVLTDKIEDYNDLISDALCQYDFEIVRDVTNYIVKRMRESSTPIANKYAYFKNSFETNCEQTHRRRNMSLDEMMEDNFGHNLIGYNWLEAK